MSDQVEIEGFRGESGTALDRKVSSSLTSAAEMTTEERQGLHPGPGGQGGPERDRIVAAFGRAAAEQGYRGLTFTRVASYAGLSPERVEAQFPSLESGLLASQEDFLQRIRRDAAEACAGPADWSLRVKAALSSVLTCLVDSSDLARVLSVEATGSSLRAAEYQFEALDEFAALLAEGRVHCPAAADFPPSMERAIVGGVASIIARHLLAEETDALLTLETELVEMILIPYVGPPEARRIARG